MPEELLTATVDKIHTPAYAGTRGPRTATTVTVADVGHSFLPVTPYGIYGPFIEILRSMDTPKCLGWEDVEEMREDDELSANLELLISAANVNVMELLPANVQKASMLDLLRSIFGSLPANMSRLVPSDNDVQQARYIQMYCQWMLDRMETPIETVRQVITDVGISYGTAVAEMTYGIDDFYGKQVLVVKNIRPIPTRDIAFVTDNFRNIIGLTSTRVPQYLPIGSFYPLADNLGFRLPNVTPRDMYMLFTWRPQAGDPRGRSAFLPARKLYLLKRQLMKDVSEWSQRYAIPSVWATTPENAVPDVITNPDGSIQTISPAQQMAQQLQQFKNSTVAVFGYGTEVHTIAVGQDGGIFIQFFDWINRQMTRAMTRQHLATNEGESHSRAAAEVHQDSLGLVINEIRRVQQQAILNDLLRPLVQANFGPQSVHLCPRVNLGKGDGLPTSPMEIANLARVGWFTESQMRVLDEELGLPMRGNDEMPINHATNKNFPGMSEARGMRDAI